MGGYNIWLRELSRYRAWVSSSSLEPDKNAANLVPVAIKIKGVEMKNYVNIYYPQPNDNWPYFQCPNCGGGFITRAFTRCIDCGVRIRWIKLKVRTVGEIVKG